MTLPKSESSSAVSLTPWSQKVLIIPPPVPVYFQMPLYFSNTAIFSYSSTFFVTHLIIAVLCPHSIDCLVLAHLPKNKEYKNYIQCISAD